MKFKIIIIVLLIFLGSLGWYFKQSDSENKDVLQLYGNIDIRQVELSFHDSEHVETMLVKEGERVKKGQLLATQDLLRFQYALDIAQAHWEEQQQVFAKLESGSRPEDINKALADVNAAMAAVKFAEKEFKRQRILVKRRLTSKEAVDRSKAELDQSRARLKALQELWKLEKIGPRLEDILAAKAHLKADATSVLLAKKILYDAHIFAPNSGIVQDRILEPGDMADAHTPVYTLALTDPVWARVFVSENQLGKLKQGMTAQITTDSYPDKTYKGWVGFISPTAEFTPKTVETTELRSSLVYQVRVFACNPQDELRLGMPATVSIALETGKQNNKGRSPCE
ncbi:MAG: efflux RND transporter periplasmic adaptor subunit [Methylococcales bacterium]